MLTIVGTGHVFRIAEPVEFIVRHTWPQAVCVELDPVRLAAITGNTAGLRRLRDDEVPEVYRASAKYQEKVSAQNDSTAGAELAAAVAEGKRIGAEIVCIDRDARQVMAEMWDEMSRGEKLRYRWSAFTDGVLGMKKVDQTQQEFAANEDEYIAKMRKKYPTLVRKLIDERNTYMVERIKKTCDRYPDVVAVVGDAHVEGLCRLLPEREIRQIRLAELLDPEKLAKVRAMVWDNKEREE
ncbi:MAG: TraB/GumN family protein [Methanomethylophilus sp.]|nr:TraB/GumN family protein [Methanomethylophilus sp.]